MWVGEVVALQDFLDYLESTTFFGVSLQTALTILLIIAVAVTVERIVARSLKRFSKRVGLSIHVTYDLVLTFRIIILIGAVGALIGVGGLPTEWLVAFSALGGAAVGFASPKTIGNFIAGLYLFAARPFKVGDYIRAGAVEGIVHDITINYTKIQTIGNSDVSISNLQILDRDIVNYRYETEKGDSIHCYTFEMGFDHSVMADGMAMIFNDVFAMEPNRFAKRPSYMLESSDAFARVYLIYLYVQRPEDIFELRPQIAGEIMKRWDAERAKLKK